MKSLRGDTTTITDRIAMAAIVAFGGALAVAFGERIGINGGQGWDGISYTQWAIDLGKTLHNGLTKYHAQRVLPSAIVSLVARHDAAHVLRAFAILNVVACTGAAILWGSLARFMQWSRPAAWAGFVALFGSFAIAKHAVYYPALTDPAAFALGMAMVWSYLTDRPVALALIAIAGVVTWPALPPLALAMLIVPRPSTDAGAPSRALPPWLALLIGVTAASVFIGFAFYYLAHPIRDVGDEKFADWVLRPWLVLTVPLLAATIIAGIYYTARPITSLVILARSLDRRRLAFSVAAAIGIYIGREIYLSRVGTQGEGPTGAQFLCEHTLAALRGPLWGLVAHFVYFGPIIAVALVVWKRIGLVAWSWGPSASFALAFIVMFAAGSNSRQWSHLVPMLVAVTIATTSSWWTATRTLVFVALALAWSKVWFHLGYDTVLNWHDFPNQRYFMNTGPYSADGPYVAHLVAAAVTVAFAWIALRREAKDAPRSPAQVVSRNRP